MIDDYMTGWSRRTGAVVKPTVYVFDLDGTLADVAGRDPYNARSCDADPVHEHVMVLARLIAKQPDLGVVCVSGRREKHRAKTARFLAWHRVPFLGLFLRADKDSRPDYEVKEEILHRDLLPRYEILAVFDDRQSVVDMWRRNGIACFQVAPGKY